MPSFMEVKPSASPKLGMGREDNLSIESGANKNTFSYEEGSNPEEESRSLSPLVAYITERYHRSRTKRQSDETRWLMCYRNYRGLYGDDVSFTSTEKSKAFIKLTKTKVLAGHAQLCDILFSTNKFPIGIEPTPVPLGIESAVHFDPKAKEETLAEGEDTSRAATSKGVSATINRKSIKDSLSLGPFENKLERVKEKIKSGYGDTPSAVTFEPAKMAAKNMEQLIHDQLEETEAGKALRHLAFEMALFGTGILKGPFAVDKEYPKWDEDGTYNPEFQTLPMAEHVSIWDAYPDPDARNMSEAEEFTQRHRMSKTQLRKLKNRPYFRKESIEEAILQGPNYQEEHWESILRDNDMEVSSDRYEALEYWGLVDKEVAEQAGLKVPKELGDYDELQVNVWICNDQILRLVLNPFNPNRIPYYAVPYELNPYSFFGVGIAENMSDTQLIMNGFMRLAIDNAVLSSNLVFEVDETNLVPGQDMTIYPGKIFRRQSGAPGQAIFSTKFTNVTNECLQMFDKARQLADESTGMPSYAHGMTNVQNTGRTASGMSMLMGAADKNIKAVVKNIDDYLLAPLGRSYFAFNMQFNFDKKYIGDVQVVALGTESLMRNEIRSQKLLQFLQTTANPIHSPYIKNEYILRELAQSLDLNPDALVNDTREASIQAEIMKKMNPQGDVQAGKGPNGTPGPEDPTGTGNGNIQPGQAPTPGAQGFTGNSAGGRQPAPASPQTPPTQ